MLFIKLILFAFLLIHYIIDSHLVNFKYSFLFLPSFPSILEDNLCSATQEIKEHHEVLRTNEYNVGFDVICYALDSDFQYLDLTEDILNENLLVFIVVYQDVYMDRIDLIVLRYVTFIKV